MHAGAASPPLQRSSFLSRRRTGRWRRRACVASLAVCVALTTQQLQTFSQANGAAAAPKSTTRRNFATTVSVATAASTVAAISPGGDLQAAQALQPAPTVEGDRRVNEFLKSVPVWAITNEEGSPALETDMSVERLGKKVAKFYLEPQGAADALKKLKDKASQKLELKVLPLSDVYLPLMARGDEKELGGQLRMEPLSAEVRHAMQILCANSPIGSSSLGPPGTVPLFMYPGLELQGAKGEAFTPAFLKEEDLKETVKRSGAKVEGYRTQVALLQDVAEKLGQASGPADGVPKNIKVIASISNVRDTSSK